MPATTKTTLLLYVVFAIRPYYRSFIESWTDAIGQLQLSAPSTWLGAALGLLVGGIFAIQRWLLPDAPSPRQAALRRYGLCFLVGFVVIGLGFIIFVPLTYHRQITERVFIFASIGGAIAVTSAILFIGHLLNHPRLIAVAVFSTVVGLASVAGLKQVLLVKAYGDQEQYMLAQIVQQAPKIADGSLILVVDKTHQTSGSLGLFGELEAFYAFNSAVQYLYHQPGLIAAMCDPDRLAGNPPQPTCILTDKAVTVAAHGTYPLNRVVAFAYEGEGQLSLLTQWLEAEGNLRGGAEYNPSALIDQSAPLPARVYSVLTSWPYQAVAAFNEAPPHAIDLSFNPPHTYFGDMPAYSFIGYGRNQNWTGATRASIDLWLAADSSYQVQARIVGSLQPNTLQTLTLAVNGQSIPLSHTTDDSGATLFTGTISQAAVVLDKQKTRLLFQTGAITTPFAIHINGDLRFLGLLFDWVRITPTNNAQS